MLLSSTFIATLLGFAVIGENADMMIGEETHHSTALLGEMADSFYGLQITSRGRNACQVRAFFRGAVPKTAQFCRGRVTSRHVDGAAVVVMGVGERVHGLSACLTRHGSVGAIRLHTQNDQSYEARMADCETEFVQVYCQEDWTIQGIQLYFDGPDDGRAHRRLRGLRPLCSAMPSG